MILARFGALSSRKQSGKEAHLLVKLKLTSLTRCQDVHSLVRCRWGCIFVLPFCKTFIRFTRIISIGALNSTTIIARAVVFIKQKIVRRQSMSRLDFSRTGSQTETKSGLSLTAYRHRSMRPSSERYLYVLSRPQFLYTVGHNVVLLVS